MKQDNQFYLDKFNQLMVPTYGPSMVPVKGEGSRVWDVEGREYIDFGGGIAVLGLGHCHPELVETLKDQAELMWHASNIYTNPQALELAEKLIKATFADRVFYCNSGAEANEAALKLARRYAVDHFSEEKNEIISFQQSFHGRTFFTVSVGGQAKHREGFGPVPEAITYAEFNNLEDVKAKISDKTCAVIMEPVQGEGGVVPATEAFAKGVAELCKENNALLIFDEVQTGFGRTGHLYAYEGLGVNPDILTSAKALGNGFPVGAMICTEKVSSSFVQGTHGSTYGGNHLAMAVANKSFDLINQPDVLKEVIRKRALLDEGMNAINNKYKIFEAFRGKGLLAGYPLVDSWKGKSRDILKEGLKEGVMTLVAGTDIIRLAPSLIIPDVDIQEGLKRLEKAISNLA